MLVANCHPAQLDEVHSGNVSCKIIYFGSCFWSFSEAIWHLPIFAIFGVSEVNEKSDASR
jgi:hypothetical protein